MNLLSLKNIHNLFKKFDKKTIALIKITNIFSYFLAISGILFLYFHYKYYISINLLYAGITFFETSLISFICSFIFAIVITQYKEKHY